MRNQKEEDIQQSIRTLIQNHENAVPGEVGSKYFDEILDQNLGLDLIGYLRYEQKGGHCSWYCMQAALFSLVILKRLEKKELNPETIVEAWRQTKWSFSRLWEEYCRTDLANQAIPLLEKHKTLFDTKAIFDDFIVTCISSQQIDPIRRLLTIIPSYAKWRHPQTGQSILQLYLSTNRSIDSLNFFHLHDLGGDLTMRDNKKQSFYEDFQAIPLDVLEYESMLKTFLASSTTKEWLLKRLEHPIVSRLFTQYHHPASNKSCAQLALESRQFYLVGLLFFLGYDFSTMPLTGSDLSHFSNPTALEEFRYHVMQYPLSMERLSHFERFTQRFEEICPNPTTSQAGKCVVS